MHLPAVTVGEQLHKECLWDSKDKCGYCNAPVYGLSSTDLRAWCDFKGIPSAGLGPSFSGSYYTSDGSKIHKECYGK